MIDVFISHPTPFNEQQSEFLILLKNSLSKYGLNSVNLGTNSWSFEKPLKPIKEMISNCKGAILVGLERHHSYIGYDKENSTSKKETIHKYTTSPWLHIEGGMAYQAGLPILILREEKVCAEGILDPNNSESYIYEFKLEDNVVKLSEQIEQLIGSWARRVI